MYYTLNILSTKYEMYIIFWSAKLLRKLRLFSIVKKIVI